MGLFNKLKFWGKDEHEFDFDKLAEKEMKTEELPKSFDQEQKEQLGLDEPSMFPEQKPRTEPEMPVEEERHPLQSKPSTAPATKERDLELINSKLDTLKAILTSTEQRIANLERAAGVEKKEQKLW